MHFAKPGPSHVCDGTELTHIVWIGETKKCAIKYFLLNLWKNCGGKQHALYIYLSNQHRAAGWGWHPAGVGI